MNDDQDRDVGMSLHTLSAGNLKLRNLLITIEAIAFTPALGEIDVQQTVHRRQHVVGLRARTATNQVKQRLKSMIFRDGPDDVSNRPRHVAGPDKVQYMLQRQNQITSPLSPSKVAVDKATPIGC